MESIIGYGLGAVLGAGVSMAFRKASEYVPDSDNVHLQMLKGALHEGNFLMVLTACGVIAALTPLSATVYLIGVTIAAYGVYCATLAKK